jgi:hypothetical protein
MRRTKKIAILLTLLAQFAQAASPQNKNDSDVIFREPFTLRLPVDRSHFYEERFDHKIPYVFDNDVYLFNGEKFGVKVTLEEGEITSVRYEKDLSKADLTFDFKQDKDQSSSLMTLLTVKNNLPRRVYFDALMTIPGKKGIFKTTVLPVEAGLSNFESWPHAIVQLALKDIRYSEKPASRK